MASLGSGPGQLVRQVDPRMVRRFDANDLLNDVFLSFLRALYEQVIEAQGSQLRGADLRFLNEPMQGFHTPTAPLSDRVEVCVDEIHPLKQADFAADQAVGELESVEHHIVAQRLVELPQLLLLPITRQDLEILVELSPFAPVVLEDGGVCVGGSEGEAGVDTLPIERKDESQRSR